MDMYVDGMSLILLRFIKGNNFKYGLNQKIGVRNLSFGSLSLPQPTFTPSSIFKGSVVHLLLH